MIDRVKLLLKLENFVPKFFIDLNQEIIFLKKSFDFILNNKDKLDLILNQKYTYNIPTFSDNLDYIKDLRNKDILNYNILAVDGSQIYPDRHFNLSCFLINIGFSYIEYNKESKVFLGSEPYIYQIKDSQVDLDFVNLKRSEIELKKGFNLSYRSKKNGKDAIFLSDGTLIFSSDNLDIIEILDHFYKHNIAIFGFISFSNSKDLVNIIKSGLELNIIPDFSKKSLKLDSVADYNLLDFFLKPFFRSNIFSSNSNILDNYPDHLKIKFCYINIEKEIVRVEFPAWLSQDINYLDSLLKIIIDQCIKGSGYPVVLSESHEQAVVKNQDKEFFLQTINYITENKLKFSQKSIKKKFINI